MSFLKSKIFITAIISGLNFNLWAQSIGPYKAYIKPGSILVRISDKKEFVADRGIYTDVMESHPTKRDVFYVYNNKGEQIYTTQPQNIVEILEDIRVHPKINAELIYPPMTTLKSSNNSFQFDTQFNIHADNISPKSFNSFHSSDVNSSNATRFEFRTIYQSNLPINFGLTTSLQSASWIDNNENKVSLRNFSFGPILEYNFYKTDLFQLKIVSSIELAPMYETSSTISKENYSPLIFGFGLEANYLSPFGTFNLGAHFRRHELSITSTTNSSTPSFDQEEITLDSLGFMMGYKLDWTL